MRRAAVILLVVCASARLAVAEPSALDRARDAWEQLEYEQVIEAADAALAAPELAAPERIEALRLRGSALVVLERTDEAELVFAKIFALDPDYELPARTSPRIRSVFDPARARWQVTEEERLATELGAALAGLRMRVELPSRPRGGSPLVVGVELVDPQAIAHTLVLAHRRQGAGYFTTTTVPAKPGRSVLTIPGEVTASRTPYTLELHVQARHRSGVTLRREGGVGQPLRLDVAAGDVPRSTPIYKRWWFWAGLGVVAVGTGLLVREVVPVGEQPVVAHPP